MLWFELNNSMLSMWLLPVLNLSQQQKVSLGYLVTVEA
jgi:hypothetical protein